MIIGDEDEDHLEDSIEESVENVLSEVKEPIKIYIHNTSDTTIRVKAVVNSKDIVLLIDTSTTYNFLNLRIADLLHYTKIIDKPMQMSVVDNYKMICTEVCRDFKWNVQGHKFKTIMRLIPLKGCDAVLGVQWFKKLGDCDLILSSLH